MSKATEYRGFLESVRSSLGYWKSYSLLQFTTSLTRIMRLDKVSGKKLSLRLGVSAAQVSKVLRGQENVTIETMTKFADALDSVVHIHVAKRGVPVQWLELPSAPDVPREAPSDPVASASRAFPPLATAPRRTPGASQPER